MADFERGRFQPLVGFQVAWLARLIREYYPACLVATFPPTPPHPALTAGRDVYPGNERGERQEGERRMTLIASSFTQSNVFFLYVSLLHLLIDGQLPV